MKKNHNSIKFQVEYEVYHNGICYEDNTGANARTCEITSPNLKAGSNMLFSLYLTSHATDPIKFTSTVNSWGTQTNSGDKEI